ncbi:MAG: NADH-quinone oxidoreductase subunit M [Ktedonobacterales bacterium]|nr:NADH-quinone oxidoreductase subunit M [Ktedonobacterales bacterium]
MLLTVTIILPLVGVLALYLVPSRAGRLLSLVALTTSGATLALAIALAARFDWRAGTPQLGVSVPWIPTIGASYVVTVDGLSLPLILLTALLMFLTVLYSWREAQRPREFYALFLLMETGLLGFFSTLDLLLFYFFFEIALVPMYFIIGGWGHERRREAALKFFLYTRVGALALLLSILALYLGVQPHTFSLPAILAAHPYNGMGIAPSLILLGFFLGFAIKLPVVPLHSWLPDAHTEAPTGGSVVLAGLLLKMGGYGFLRLALPTVPGAFQQWGLWLAALAVFSAIYGAAVAMGQRDLKRLVAFSSINHMGYVLLGVAVAGAAGVSAADRATAATGATYQMVAHGLVTGGLFFLVGMLSDRTGTREIGRLSGLWASLPLWGSILTFAMFASLGLPALAQFAAEVQIILGALGLALWAAIGMLVAILITTAMFLWTLQRILLGKTPPEWAKLPQLSAREVAVLAPLVVLIVALGIVPGPLSGIIEGALRGGPIAPLGPFLAYVARQVASAAHTLPLLSVGWGG